MRGRGEPDEVGKTAPRPPKWGGENDGRVLGDGPWVTALPVRAPVLFFTAGTGASPG